MAQQSMRFPIELEVANLQQIIEEVRSKMGTMKFGTAGFNELEKVLRRLESEVERLQSQASKPIISSKQFTAAENAIAKIDENLDKLQSAANRIKFSDLKLDASQQAQLNNLNDQIKTLRENIKRVKDIAKSDFLMSDLGKMWSEIDVSAASRSLDQLTNKIRSSVDTQKKKIDEAQSQLEKLQKSITLSDALGDKDPLSKLLSKQQLDQFFNDKGNFRTGQKTEFENWLRTSFTISDDTIQSLMKLNGAKVREAFASTSSALRQELERSVNPTAKSDYAKVTQDLASYNAELGNLQKILTGVQDAQTQAGKDATAYEGQIKSTQEAIKGFETTCTNAARNSLEIGKSSQQASAELSKLSTIVGQVNEKFLQQERIRMNFNSIKMAIVNFMGFNQILNITKKAVREALNHIKELDTVMNNISIVTNMTTHDLWQQVDAYSDMAQKYGTSIKGAYEVSQIYYQQGLQTNEVLTLTNETLKLAKISGLDYATTTDYMTTALRGFKIEAADASRIVDVYSNLAAHTAATQEELAVAMSKTASSLASVGSSFEEGSAMIGTMVAVTRESATNIGSAIKSIAARYGEMKKDPLAMIDAEGDALSYNKVDAALQSVGITLKDTNGQFRNFTDVIIELGEKWDELESTQQRYIATQFAGNRQQSRFLALVSNVDLLKQNLAYAEESEDTGTLQALKALDSIESKTEQVRVAYQQMYTTIGAETAWKGLLDVAKNIMNTFNGLPKLFGKIPIGAAAMVWDFITIIKTLGLKAFEGLSKIWDHLLPENLGERGTTIARQIGAALRDEIKAEKAQNEQAGKDMANDVVSGASQAHKDLNQPAGSKETKQEAVQPAQTAAIVQTEKIEQAAQAEATLVQASQTVADNMQVTKEAAEATKEAVTATTGELNTQQEITAGMNNLRSTGFGAILSDRINAEGIDLSQATPEIIASISKIIEAIKSEFPKINEEFENIGSTIDQSVVIGLLQSIGMTYDAAAQVAKSVLQGLHDGADMGSPSPTVIAMFKNGIGDAINIGLRASTTSIETVAQKLGMSIPEALQEALASAKKIDLTKFFSIEDSRKLLTNLAEYQEKTYLRMESTLQKKQTMAMFDGTKSEIDELSQKLEKVQEVLKHNRNVQARIRNVEYEKPRTDYLTASHAIDVERLSDLADWGGMFIRPSFAVRAKDDVPWTQFGGAVFHFGRDYIDPSQGKVLGYHGDGYTPTARYTSKKITADDLRADLDSQPPVDYDHFKREFTSFITDASQLYSMRQMLDYLKIATRLPFVAGEETDYREQIGRRKEIVIPKEEELVINLEDYIQNGGFGQKYFGVNAERPFVEGAETAKTVLRDSIYQIINDMRLADAMGDKTFDVDSSIRERLYTGLRDQAGIDLSKTQLLDESADQLVATIQRYIAWVDKVFRYDWFETKSQGDVGFNKVTGSMLPYGDIDDTVVRKIIQTGIDPRRLVFYDEWKESGPLSSKAMDKYLADYIPGVAQGEHGPLVTGPLPEVVDLEKVRSAIAPLNLGTELTSTIEGDISTIMQDTFGQVLLNSLKASMASIDFSSEDAQAQLEEVIRAYVIRINAEYFSRGQHVMPVTESTVGALAMSYSPHLQQSVVSGTTQGQYFNDVFARSGQLLQHGSAADLNQLLFDFNQNKINTLDDDGIIREFTSQITSGFDDTRDLYHSIGQENVQALFQGMIEATGRTSEEASILAQTIISSINEEFSKESAAQLSAPIALQNIANQVKVSDDALFSFDDGMIADSVIEKLSYAAEDMGMDISTLFNSVGQDVAISIVQGLLQNSGIVGNASSTIANIIVDSLRSTLDMHSPSPMIIAMFREGVGDGIKLGLESSIAGVEKAAEKLGLAVTDELREAIKNSDTVKLEDFFGSKTDAQKLAQQMVQNELVGLEKLKQARLDRKEGKISDQEYGNIRDSIKASGVNIAGLNFEKQLNERMESLKATLQQMQELSTQMPVTPQTSTNVAAEEADNRTAVQTIQDRIAALEKLSIAYQQVEIIRHKTDLSAKEKSEREIENNEKIIQLKKELASSGESELKTVEQVSSALERQKALLSEAAMLDEKLAQAVANKAAYNTNYEADYEADKFYRIQNGQYTEITEKEYTDAYQRLTEAVNQATEAITRFKAAQAQAPTASENEQPAGIEQDSQLVAKIRKVGDAALKHSKGLSQFGAALSMVSGLFDKSSRGGQVAAGAITAFGGALRVIPPIIEAVKNGMASMPWMAIAMGVMAIVNGISMAIETPAEKLERLNKVAEEANNKAKEAKANYKTLDNSINKINELTEKRHESAEAAEEYQTAVDELAEKFPELIAGFDESGNIILDTTSAEKVLTDARRKSAEATYDAAKQELAAAEEKRKQAINALSNTPLSATGTSYVYDAISTLGEDLENAANDLLAIHTANISASSSDFNNAEDKVQRLAEGVNDVLNSKDAVDQTIWDNMNQYRFLVGGFKEGNFSFDNIAEYLNTKEKNGIELTDIEKNFRKTFLENINTQLIDDFNQAVNEYNDLLADESSSNEARLEAFNKAQNAYQNAIDAGVMEHNAELEAAFASVGKELSNYETVNNVYKGYQKEVISAWQQSAGANQKAWSYLSKSSSAAAMVTKEIQSTVKDDNWDKASKDSNLVAQWQGYQQTAADFLRTLNENRLDLFNTMAADTSNYTAEDIIKEFGLDATKGFGKIIFEYYAEGTQDITKRLNAELSKAMGNTPDVSGNYLTITEANVEDDEFYKKFLEVSKEHLNIVNERYLNDALKQYQKLKTEGYTDKAESFGSSAMALYEYIEQLPLDIQKSVWASVEENGITTKEGLEKIWGLFGNYESEFDSNAWTEVKNTFEALKKSTLVNIGLMVETAIDNLTSTWEDTSKTLSQALSSGVSIKDVDSLLDKAKNLDFGDEEGISLKDFQLVGNKLVLTEEAYNRYYNATIRSMNNRTKEINAELDKVDGLNVSSFIEEDFNAPSGNLPYTVKLSDSYNQYKEALDALGISKDQFETVLAGEGPAAAQKLIDDAIADLKARGEYYEDLAKLAEDQLMNAEDRRKGIYKIGGVKQNAAQLKAIASANARLTKGQVTERETKTALNTAYSTLFSDVFSKGIENINLADYEGLIDEHLVSLDTILKSGDYVALVKAYGEYAGWTTEQMNEQLIQAMDKMDMGKQYATTISSIASAKIGDRLDLSSIPELKEKFGEIYEVTSEYARDTMILALDPYIYGIRHAGEILAEQEAIRNKRANAASAKTLISKNLDMATARTFLAEKYQVADERFLTEDAIKQYMQSSAGYVWDSLNQQFIATRQTLTWYNGLIQQAKDEGKSRREINQLQNEANKIAYELAENPAEKALIDLISNYSNVSDEILATFAAETHIDINKYVIEKNGKKKVDIEALSEVLPAFQEYFEEALSQLKDEYISNAEKAGSLVTQGTTSMTDITAFQDAYKELTGVDIEFYYSSLLQAWTFDAKDLKNYLVQAAKKTGLNEEGQKQWIKDQLETLTVDNLDFSSYLSGTATQKEKSLLVRDLQNYYKTHMDDYDFTESIEEWVESQINDTLEVLSYGGQQAINRLKSIKGELTQDEVEAAYRAQIEPLKQLADSIEDLQAGSVVAKNQIQALIQAGFKVNSDGVITSTEELVKVYASLYVQMKNTNEATIAELNTMMGKYLDNRDGEQQAIDALSNAASMTYSQFAEIYTQAGIELTNEMVNSLEAQGIIKGLGGSQMMITDFKAFAETLGWNPKSEEYIKGFKAYNDALIDYDRNVEKSITESLKSIASAKPGDKINLTELASRLDKGLDTVLKYKGAELRDGILTIQKGANISAIIKDLGRRAAENAGLIPSEMEELSEAIREFLSGITSLIQSGIKGNLSSTDKNSLVEWANTQGIKDLQFRETVDGFKLANESAIELYNTVSKINDIQGQIVFNDLKDTLIETDDRFKSASANAATIAELSQKTTSYGQESFLRSLNGNVDVWNRPVLKNSDGTISTLLTATEESRNYKSDIPWVMNITPITPDGKKLSDVELQEYIQKLVDQSGGDMNRMIKLDKADLGLIIEGQNTDLKQQDQILSKYDDRAESLHEIGELIEEIKDSDDYNDAKVKQYREELALAQKIAEARGLTEDDSFKFMEQDIPSGQKNPLNYWENWGKAFKVINESTKGSTKGTMAYEDFYNLITEMSNLQRITGTSMNIGGKVLENAEATAGLIEQAAGALEVQSDGSLKINLSKIGIDFAQGTDAMANNIDDGIHKVAQSQIDMLDALIGLLEAIVTMEDAFKNLDVDSDLSLDLNEIFNIEDNKISDFGPKWKETLESWRKMMTEGTEEFNEDFTRGMESIKFTINGQTLSLAELIKKDFDELPEGMTPQLYQSIMNGIWEAARNGDYTEENVKEIIMEKLSKSVEGVGGEVTFDMGNYTFIGTGSANYMIEWDSEAAKAAMEKLGSTNHEDLIAAYRAADKGEAKAVQVEAKLIAEGILKVEKRKVTVTTPDGSTQEIDLDKLSSDEAGEAAAMAALGSEQLTSMGAENVIADTETGSVKGTVKCGEVDVDLSFKDGKVTYSAQGQEGNNLNDLVNNIVQERLKDEGELSDEERAIEEIKITREVKAEFGISSFELTSQSFSELNAEAQKAIQDAISTGDREYLKLAVKLDPKLEGMDLENLSLSELEETIGEKETKITVKGDTEQAVKDLRVLSSLLTLIRTKKDIKIKADIDLSDAKTDLDDLIGKIDELKSPEIWNLMGQAVEGGLAKITDTAGAAGEAVDTLKSKLQELIEKFQELGNQTAEPKVNMPVDGVRSQVEEIQGIIDRITGTSVTVSVNYSDGGGLPAINKPGSGKVNNPNISQYPSATGNIGLAQAKGTLMGELGPELVVSNGQYFVAGQNGAEFVDLDTDAIVFNHLQTEQLLKHGMSKQRGQAVTNERNAVAFAQGNISGPAMASAKAVLSQLKQLRAMWQSILGSSVKDLAGLGGTGGGGGSSKDKTADPKVFIKQLEIWYNWLQRIAVLEQKINYEEARRNEISSNFKPSGKEYVESLKESLDYLKESAATNQSLVDSQQEYFEARREKLNTDNGPFDKLYEFDKFGQLKYKDGRLEQFSQLVGRDKYGNANMTAEEQYKQLIAIDPELAKYMETDSSGNKIDKEQDDWYVTAVQAFWDKMDSDKEEMQSLHDSIEEHKQAVLEQEQQMNEILHEIEENQMEVEGKMLNAYVETRQRAIDELQKERDALEEASTNLIDGLSDQLKKERDMYSKKEDQTELTSLQRQLAILQRSGGSASQIASLQKDISQRQQDAYFEAQQAEIDALQEASDKQIEKLDQEIDLETEQLEYEKQHGMLWQQIYDYMTTMSAKEMSQYIANNTEAYWGQSPTELAKTMRDDLFSVEKYKEVAGGPLGSVQQAAELYSKEALQKESEAQREEEARQKAAAEEAARKAAEEEAARKRAQEEEEARKRAAASSASTSAPAAPTVDDDIAIVTWEKQLGAMGQWRYVGKDRNGNIQTTGSWQGGYGPAKHASGGYVGHGIYELGERGTETVLTAEQTQVLRNNILSNRPNSLISLLKSYNEGYNNIGKHTNEVQAFYDKLNSDNSIIIQNATVEMQVSKIANDYDAQRAGEQALEKMVEIARKTAAQNRIGR